MDRGTTEIPAVHSTEQLRKSVAAFKDSLKLPTAELNEKQEINPNNHFIVFCTQVQDHSLVFWRDL